MAAAIKQDEAVPASYPTGGQDAIWQRIEAYIAHRWTERVVVWTVEGPGEWEPPLTPAIFTTSEVWNGAEWEAIEAPGAPLGGFWLSGEGPYRFTASVGSGTPPANVLEAVARLAAYLADDTTAPAGARSFSVDIPGVQSTSVDRDPRWVAKALQLSGAADLLRNYRRV